MNTKLRRAWRSAIYSAGRAVDSGRIVGRVAVAWSEASGFVVRAASCVGPGERVVWVVGGPVHPFDVVERFCKSDFRD